MRRFGLAAVASLALVTGAHGSATPADIVAKIRVGGQPCSVAMASGSAWATVFADDEVVRIEPATNRVVKRIAVDGGPCGITSGAGSLWLMNFGTATVQRINPETNAVTATIQVGT
jgi:DNA-binding beta-propeller fold protein YncE